MEDNKLDLRSMLCLFLDSKGAGYFCNCDTNTLEFDFKGVSYTHYIDEINVQYSVQGCVFFYESVLEFVGMHVSTPIQLIEAVAHVGIDFGYGEYKLDKEFINQARALLENYNKSKEVA